MPEPLIIADPSLRTPEGRTYWTSPEMGAPGTKRPLTFSVAEVAKSFFGMSPGWMRHHLRIEYLIEGEAFVAPRSAAGDRYFLLHDIERWAHALTEYGVLDGRHLELVIVAVKNTAQLHRFIA